MGELPTSKALALSQISEILLVVDAMIGQEAANVAREFNEQLEVTGVILTKIDGDTRGGAALSSVRLLGKPIKFTGTGEKSRISKPSTQTVCLAGSSVWGYADTDREGFSRIR